jgi:hypothetical protein
LIRRHQSASTAVRLLLTAWLSVTAAAPAAGGLRFDKSRLEIKVAPEQQQVEAAFEFTNHGLHPALIEAVASDCACLKAEAPKDAIAPGATGKVSSLFEIGNFRGLVEKPLWVTVRQDGRKHRVPLDVAIVVPELVELRPRTLTWTAGDKTGQQSFRVKVLWNEPIRLLSVECSRPEDFDLRIETRAEGREYIVHARPLVTDRPAIAAVRFVTDCRIAKYRTPIGFVHVRRR